MTNNTTPDHHSSVPEHVLADYVVVYLGSRGDSESRRACTTLAMCSRAMYMEVMHPHTLAKLTAAWVAKAPLGINEVDGDGDRCLTYWCPVLRLFEKKYTADEADANANRLAATTLQAFYEKVSARVQNKAAVIVSLHARGSTGYQAIAELCTHGKADPRVIGQAVLHVAAKRNDGDLARLICGEWGIKCSEALLEASYTGRVAFVDAACGYAASDEDDIDSAFMVACGEGWAGVVDALCRTYSYLLAQEGERYMVMADFRGRDDVTEVLSNHGAQYPEGYDRDDIPDLYMHIHIAVFYARLRSRIEQSMEYAFSKVDV